MDSFEIYFAVHIEQRQKSKKNFTFAFAFAQCKLALILYTFLVENTWILCHTTSHACSLKPHYNGDVWLDRIKHEWNNSCPILKWSKAFRYSTVHIKHACQTQNFVIWIWVFAGVSPPQPLSSPQQPITKTISMDIHEEEVTIKIVREPGTGLGISIAGGIGSTPYRGDDEVR